MPTETQASQPQDYGGRHHAAIDDMPTIGEYAAFLGQYPERTRHFQHGDYSVHAPAIGAPTVKSVLQAHGRRHENYDPARDPQGLDLTYRHLGQAGTNQAAGAHRYTRPKHRRPR